MTPPICMGYAKPNFERFELRAWSLTPFNFLYKLYALKIIVFINIYKNSKTKPSLEVIMNGGIM